MKIAQIALAFLTSAVFFEPTDAQFCVENIEEIYTAEDSVTDTSRRRTYVLCPRRIFEIGTLDHNFDLNGANVNPPLPIRSNMTIRCGDTGLRDNLCWVAEGDLHVDATPFRGISDETVEGVRMEGIVFIGARQYSTWATKPGDITYSDCEWKDFTNSTVPIMLDFFDGGSSQLSVTFDNCDFHDNRYFGIGSHSSLIYANGPQNAITLKDTRFDDNDMVHNNTLSTTNSFIIETLGPLTMEKTCFRNNAVGVSNVAVFGSSFSNKENFATNSTGDLCEFASVFENLQQFDSFSPLCVSTGSNVCLAGTTSAPTTTPSAAPSASPTEVPSASPTGQPTLSPAPTIVGTTPSPTVQPTNFQPPVGFAFPTEPPASSSGASWIRVSGVSTLLAGALLFL